MSSKPTCGSQRPSDFIGVPTMKVVARSPVGPPPLVALAAAEDAAAVADAAADEAGAETALEAAADAGAALAAGLSRRPPLGPPEIRAGGRCGAPRSL